MSSKAVVQVSSLAGSDFVASRLKGNILRNKLSSLLSFGRLNVIVDFSGIEDATQSALDEFLGVLIREEGPSILDRIEIVNSNDKVKSVIRFVVNYSLNNIEA